MRCDHKMPYTIFPGIFASIDTYTKRMSRLHFARHERIPRWFDGFGDLGVPIKAPHHSRFKFVDAATNVMLTGDPDEVFRRPDGSLFIVDDKCARFTGHQDELLPMYVTQLNAYALIAERTGLGRVTGLGLVYHEPVTDIGGDAIDSVCGDEGFSMRFVAKLLPIELHPTMIPPLLARVREICDLPAAPVGRPDCEDCERVERLVEAAG
jgi:hypothetical protein